MRNLGAVAVDLGASSARYAAGWHCEGRIKFHIVRQISNCPVERHGRLEWDFDALVGLAREAATYAAEQFEESTLGIDSWGVDHGFVDNSGRLVQPPVCYRDPSHERAFQELESRRSRLYELTGVQHQPFNTLYQLFARGRESPRIKSFDWLLLPDLLGLKLTGERHRELTQSSTTGLLGLDGSWCSDVFEAIDWPLPESQPKLPGKLGAEITERVRLAHVGSHDTASAFCGMGSPEQLMLNVGSWSLLGTVVDEPIVTAEAEAANFTNERSVDGRVRFLKNVPGFYVINRLHQELGIRESVGEWLRLADLGFSGRVDLESASLFSPESMVDACVRALSEVPTTDAEWAGMALASLSECLAEQRLAIQKLTGRRWNHVRVAGGGSRSEAFCRRLARDTGCTVVAGPIEATVLGNLAMQLFASGLLSSHQEMQEVVEASAEVLSYDPEETARA